MLLIVVALFSVVADILLRAVHWRRLLAIPASPWLRDAWLLVRRLPGGSAWPFGGPVLGAGSAVFALPHRGIASWLADLRVASLLSPGLPTALYQ